ncbi:MAG TPA: tryptophanase [Fimbriimonadaceae bacterium]|nr:tryptophanase [Fimbriimonadaceae bacterium]
MPEIIEPFRIKSVEPIRFTTPEEREKILARSHWNPFQIDADDVLIDLLTDSGTSAMSAAQWGAIMTGDESYAGSRSFKRFASKVQEITGFKHVIPVHQGRAAEKILMSLVGGAGKVIPSNNHFDTTRANIEFTGTEAADLVVDEAKNFDMDFPFKGNIDPNKLKALIEARRPDVPIGMITVTNNTGGGQPVSMANVREVSSILRGAEIPFYIDACRFAENAWFIKQREAGYEAKSPKAIAQEMFSYADGATMSLKKDGFGNIGGFLALNDDALAEQARNLLILTEGFPTYGGMAGRDLEALAVGLDEVLDERYLEYRAATVRYLAERLLEIGVYVVRPPGGHAVYIDAKRFYPQIPASQFPAQVFVCELYRTGGIRGVEIGSAMFGRNVDGVEVPATQELVRLALPRRVYTQAHVNYVGEVIAEMYKARDAVRGLKMVKQAPFLRHFTAEFAVV